MLVLKSKLCKIRAYMFSYADSERILQCIGITNAKWTMCSFKVGDESVRKQHRSLAELHYSKAVRLFLSLSDAPCELLRTLLERVAFAEFTMAGQSHTLVSRLLLVQLNLCRLLVKPFLWHLNSFYLHEKISSFIMYILWVKATINITIRFALLHCFYQYMMHSFYIINACVCLCACMVQDRAVVQWNWKP